MAGACGLVKSGRRSLVQDPTSPPVCPDVISFWMSRDVNTFGEYCFTSGGIVQIFFADVKEVLLKKKNFTGARI